MPAFLAPIAGAVVGGLVNKGSGGGGQASAERAPWAEAQPWLKDQIATGQKLQKFYQDNPFSPMQQQAYRNLFAGVDNFNTGVAPGLLSIVNKYMPGAKMSMPQTMNYSGLLDQAFSPQANPFYKAPTTEAPSLLSNFSDEDTDFLRQMIERQRENERIANMSTGD